MKYSNKFTEDSNYDETRDNVNNIYQNNFIKKSNEAAHSFENININTKNLYPKESNK